MRADVLELMAEEILGRPVSDLASFTSFDGDGRRKLDGMSKGKKWDVLRGGDERKFERATKVEIKRLMKLRCRQRRPEVYLAQSRRREIRDKEKRARQRRARYWKNHDRSVAKQRAYRAEREARP